MKECSKCKEIKSKTDFYIAKDKKSGYTSHCKSCRNIQQKEYRSRPEVKLRKRLYMMEYWKIYQKT